MALMSESRIYLDHAAGTPVHPAALAEARGWWARSGPSASSSHEEGRALKDALEGARTDVARALGARPREIVFTSGATEAARIAVQGLAGALPPTHRRVVTTAVEHAAIREPLEALAKDGVDVVVVPVTAHGAVDPAAFLAQVTDNTGFAVVQAVNHEMGALQPLEAIAPELTRRGIPLLCDASLAPGRIPCTTAALPAHVLVFSGTKFGGLPGTGMLMLKRGTRLAGLPGGGLQEEGVRPGSENVPGIVGMARAFVDTLAQQPSTSDHLRACSAILADAIEDTNVLQVVARDAPRAPGIDTVFAPGVEGEAWLINLDLAGVSVASGSTCALGSHDPSPTLLAMGMSKRDASSTIRLSYAAETTHDAMRKVGALVKETATRLRHLARGR